MLTKIEFNRCVSFLRKIFYWGSSYRIIKKRQHIQEDCYKCAGCEMFVCKVERTRDKLIATYPEVQAFMFICDKMAVDHVIPVGTLSGSLDEAADRIFCDESNLQLLCGFCHYSKTQLDLEDIKKGKMSLLERIQHRHTEFTND